MTSSLRLKSLSDPVSPEDGTRILVTRWPSRSRILWEQWFPNVDPSVQLLTQALRRPRTEETWAWYRERFLEEMRHPLPLSIIREFQRRLAAGETLTLLCYCRDEAHCHRSLLRDLILGVH